MINDVTVYKLSAILLVIQLYGFLIDFSISIRDGEMYRHPFLLTKYQN